MARKLIVVTGLSGAGKSTVIKTLEDGGYYTIDNLPMVLFEELLDVPYLKEEDIALGIDIRDVRNIELLREKIEEISGEIKMEIIFVEAESNVIVGRYKETRRKHPLGDPILEMAIERERELLTPIRERADRIIDTTNLSPTKLREIILSMYSKDPRKKLFLVSFSYSKGIPSFTDILIDARVLPNPYYVDDLKKLTGLDEKVRRFFEGREEVGRFLKEVFGFVMGSLSGYYQNGRSLVVLSVGCTGGKHRSVYLVEKLYKLFVDSLTGEFEVSKLHRDLN
ncbi:MAG: RNase adapter RapZ [Thermosulfidibacteraceae bacterium]|jgi:UPF0042 nucleotide-binding protein